MRKWRFIHSFSDISVQTKKTLATSSGHSPTGQGQAASAVLPFGEEMRVSVSQSRRAIEDDAFPFEHISDIAEAESWRKEINRPVYHIHKWWAQRLGSVFRAIILGVFSPSGTDILSFFYKPVRLDDVVVFDPFMGSGTTLGETLKLGGRAIGRDINPVAHFLVANALRVHDRQAIDSTFEDIRRDVGETIRSYYRAGSDDGSEVDVLYFFWVKTVDCPECTQPVDLFASRIFSRNAYPGRKPSAQSLCPHCDGVVECRHDAVSVQCSDCGKSFDPQSGPARGVKATCSKCSCVFPIRKTIEKAGRVPDHRLYAKMILLPDGTKRYVRITADDRRRFDDAARELDSGRHQFPVVKIQPGFNTDQALGYNYRYWHEMFNARQLLCISLLAERIQKIPDPSLKALFTCLLSGVLEFNNMFASFKGEGTGAVRHMFAHHILKPERVPLEANVWGTPKSSGSFSTMFAGRIRRALDYADDPFEIALGEGKRGNHKVFGISKRLGHPLATNFDDFESGKFNAFVSCGDSSSTDISDASVDAVVSDPPFFDNVHYSQLADFFHVWQRHVLDAASAATVESTRSLDEVQSEDIDEFTTRLTGVWREAHRVLKADGVLAFSYHHSRHEGWRCVLRAVMDAGFHMTACHPIKAEMSVAMPKSQAKEPIDLDVIIVCRKGRSARKAMDPIAKGLAKAALQVQRFSKKGRNLSRNDIRVIVTSQVLLHLSQQPSLDSAVAELDASESDLNTWIENQHQRIRSASKP